MKKLLLILFLLLGISTYTTGSKLYMHLYQSTTQIDSNEVTYSIIAQFFENGVPNELYVGKDLKKIGVFQISYIDANKIDFMEIYVTIHKYLKKNEKIDFKELKAILKDKHNITLLVFIKKS